jgi:Sulfotransferase family
VGGEAHVTSSIMKPWRNNTKSAKVRFNPEEIMRRADTLFRDEQSKDLQGVIAEKLEQLQHYDILAMDRVVAILSWGRSGSLLLASYLDGHEDVMLLPGLCGEKLYLFFDRFQSLSLRDKLIGYAAFEPHYPRFFDGEFAISRSQYYAAVQAILEFYGNWPPEFLDSRRAFFLFVHIAYNLALGRRPPGSHPLVVYALHMLNDGVATSLVEDFPQAKFVHTIRDPISSCDGMFHFYFGTVTKDFPRTYSLAPHWALYCLTNQDRPHVGMEPRTRTIRFEDLHSDAAQTIGDLSDWLGLSFQPALLNSTFNGNPYVVRREGVAWSGSRREQVQRRSLYLPLKDRVLLYALFYENCVDWNYPCPKAFGNPIVRFIVFVSLILVPMRMELIAALGMFMGWTLPLVRRGKMWPAIKSLLGIGFYHLKIIRLLAPAFFRRLAYKTTLLQIDNKKRALEHPDVDAFAKGSETPCGRS